ncbi:MAG: hypothetical protein KA151_10190, partial [Piscinibacter sp.]|nr:hypothetical protein [Piscinibacter sp.]
MSDLLTPLQWSQPDRDALPEFARSRSGIRAAADGDDAARPGNAVFAWPAPPFAAYPQAIEQQPGEACEIVGLNDKRMQGRLIFFVPDEGIVQVQVPPARTTMALRLNQFKSLRVLPPVTPSMDADARPAADDPHGLMLDHRPRSVYCVTLAAGGELSGQTIGHVETAHGLFLFPPLDEDGSVERLFVPREAYTSLQVGERIGDVLVAQRSATPRQIAEAVQAQEQ